MKKLYYILLLSLLCGGASLAQIQISPLLSDPHRQANKNVSNTGNFRMAAGASITANTKVRDTLKLPFFDDFTSITPPIDSFQNQMGQPLRMTTYSLHGLYNGDKIIIFNAKTNANLPSDALINTTHYVKRIDPFTVELYSDPTLLTSVAGSGSPIVNVNRGTWIRSNYKWNPNPDTLKWENTGGVYINNRYGISPPSYNVATFDGLDANGKAYSSNIYAIAGADTLTSLPINLLPYSPADALILSFYWQGGGVGDIPDESSDSINLQMKNKNGAWNIVWSMKGDSTALAFKQTLLAIKDPLYFYNGFQFRFHSYGNISGSFDVWNLDYILLDKNRTVTDSTHRDLAISAIPVSILKNYTAIPYKDFFRFKSLKDSGHYVIKNLQNTIDQLSTNSNSMIKDEFTNHFFQTIPISPPSPNVPALAVEALSFKIDSSTIVNLSHPVKLKYLISGSTSDDVTFGADYRTNDSASSYNMLDNYYAYDDSSAEWGAGLNSYDAEMAIKYVLTKASTPDTLIGVDIYFPHILTERSGEPFVLTVWRSINPDNIIRQQSIALSYTNSNQFKRFMLDSILIVSDSFYVGYVQHSNYYVPIGFDKNTDSHTNVFYNTYGAWLPFPEAGSFMIRPVFGSTVSLVTSVF
ncbi:MAG TPA: hypothetical protein VNW99_03470, partial [Cytophagaceae bacterium]|nr:hypothetical protein [Cytophagaceae bacterium]